MQNSSDDRIENHVAHEGASLQRFIGLFQAHKEVSLKLTGELRRNVLLNMGSILYFSPKKVKNESRIVKDHVNSVLSVLRGYRKRLFKIKLDVHFSLGV